MRRQNDPEPIKPATSHHTGHHLGISRRIPLISLKYVLAVAEHLNFGHAAPEIAIGIRNLDHAIMTAGAVKVVAVESAPGFLRGG